MTVAVLAWLVNIDTRYSVAQCTLDTLNLLRSKNCEVVFIVREKFEDAHLIPDNVEVRYLPEFNKPASFLCKDVDISDLEAYAFEADIALNLALEGVDVLITQDIVFNPQFIGPLYLLKKHLEENKNLSCIHWTHSVPHTSPNLSPDLLPFYSNSLPNSTYIALTYSGIKYISKRFNIPEGDVRVIPNWLNLEDTLNLSEQSKSIIHSCNIYKNEFLLLFPSRLARGKQADKAIKLLKAFLDNNVTACLLLCLSYTEGEEKLQELKELKELVLNLGLEDFVKFSTDLLPAEVSRIGLRREELLDLYKVFNILVHSSTLESFGLTLLEAAAHNLHLIINYDVEAFREFSGPSLSNYKHQNAYLLSWGGLERAPKYYPSEELWLKDRAREIIDNIRTDPRHNANFKLRSRLTPDIVWEQYFLPTLEESLQRL